MKTFVKKIKNKIMENDFVLYTYMLIVFQIAIFYPVK